jgi:hypothetical protein
LTSPSEALLTRLFPLSTEEVFATGLARIIYSHGTSQILNISLPGFLYATGRIVNGVLRFRLPVPDRPELVYRFTDGTLQGTYKGEGRITMTRVPDVRQVGCGALASARPPGVAASRPRDRLTAAEL